MTTEANAVEIDPTVFAASVTVPASPFPALPVVDLRPAKGSAMIDAGVAIPGLSNDFAADAPDIGAYELGDALSHYGPLLTALDPRACPGHDSLALA